MAATPLDIVVMQRNAAGTKFVETVIPDNSNGFLGYNGSNIPVIRNVVGSDITNSEITYSKIQNISGENIILGRISTGVGVLEELTANDTISILNTASSSKLSLNRIAAIGNNTVLGNISGSSASPIAQSADNLITILNTASTSLLNFSRLENIVQYRILGSVTVGTNPVVPLTPDDIIDLLNEGTIPLNATVAPGSALSNISNNTILGNNSGISAPPSELSPNSVIGILQGSSNALTATQIPTINYSKIQNISAENLILGRITSGAGTIEELAPNDIISILNNGTNPLNATVAPGGSSPTIANNTILGNNTGITATAIALSADDTITLLNTASSSTINFARIANVAQYRILGSITSGTNPVSALTPDNVVSFLNQGTTALNTTIVPRVNSGNFTALFREVALGTVTTTQNIDVTSTETPLRLVVTATLSSANVTFNFTNLSSGLKGMEIVLIITNGGTSRNVSIQETGADTNTTSGIYGYTKPTSIPSGTTGNTIFGMIWDGTKLHVNNLKYSSTLELNASYENKAKVYENWADFENGVVGSIYTSTTTGTGATSAHVANTSTSVPQLGIHRMSTGSTATGRGSLMSGAGSVLFGIGSVCFEAKNVSLSALQSAAVNEYFFDIGFIDTVTAEPTDGVYFEYNITNPTTWTICTANNSTRTKTNSSVTISAAAFYNLKIEINTTGTSVSYFINNVNVGTITTNIPTTLARVTGIGATMRKTVGTTAITADIDSMYVKYVFNNTR